MLRQHGVKKNSSCEKKHADAKVEKSFHLEDKKELEHFDYYYDDSSDEDEINEKTSSYSVSKNWQAREKQSETKFKGRDPLNNEELLSFVAHAAGILILYSEDVNKQYYPLKKHSFNEQKGEKKASDELHESIKRVVIDAADKGFESTKKFYFHSEKRKSSRDQLIKANKQARSEFITEVDHLIADKLPTFTRWLKQRKYTQKSITPDEITALEKEMSVLLKTTFEKHFSLDSKDQDRKGIQEELFDIARQKILDISLELEFNKKEKSAGREEALVALDEYKSSYPHLVQEMKSIVQNSPALGYVHNTLAKKADDEKKKDFVLRAYTQDLLAMHDSRTKAKQLSEEEKKVLQEYLTVSNRALQDELCSSFVLSLQTQLEQIIKSFYRPTLTKSHLFASDNPYGFYANLRLSNRSQKRKIANLQHTFYKTDSSTNTWRLTAKSPAAADVLESQEILVSLGRRDLILSLGNYEKVHEAIKQLKSYFHKHGADIDDKTIADWLRQTFKGTLPTFTIPISTADQLLVTNKLQSIVYLLFGCEATRNPAMHVVNQMLLDLIIAETEWTFEEALTGKRDSEKAAEDTRRTPMAPEGAVSVARALDTDYRMFMPYRYYYRGVEDKKSKGNNFTKAELIKLEARVVREWIQLKTQGRINVSKPQMADWLLEKITDEFENWLGHTPPAPDKKVINARK